MTRLLKATVCLFSVVLLGATSSLIGRCLPDESAGNAGQAPKPSPEAVNNAIALATGYLERMCGPDGKFVYMVDVGSGRQSPSYDIIRHAGAMYALAMANRRHHDTQAVETLVRAAKFLRQNYIGAGARPDQLGVWSNPLDHRAPAEGNYAELGGTGLGLVALAAVRQVDGSAVSLEDLQALGRFVLYLQKDDGSFIQKYTPDTGPVPNWGVVYYPGETALGLIALYEADHSDQWLLASAKTLAYLAKTRTGQATVPADHWALIATAALMPHADQVRSVISRDELIQHASQICNSILHDQFRGSAPVGLDGAFDTGGRTAPAATRLEGLLAASEFLPDGELREKIKGAIERGLRFLLRAQVTNSSYSGGVPGAVRVSSLDSGEVRVDYVQHALCAWLRYASLIQTNANRRW